MNDQATPERIRKSRVACGLSQTEFGRRMEPPVSQAVISDVERGVQSPTVAWLARAAVVLDVSPRELIPRS